ncbi:50S ribosomal protein L11 methyltransferase [Asticcacaulis sp.]|uniref:50S ribosomal protein L11 methyltransferase n=1 Tax=Asticcacaulis sp. TaxID=1872648 RepID=UPI00260533CE|nr:50S ribosomal protein L11 methyltransferase [Asticcacaulis sp.]
MTELEYILDAWPMLRGKGPDVWATFAHVLLDKGKGVEAFTLALAAHEHPDCGNRDRALARFVLNAGVPGWHWDLVRDKARNAAYETALRRVVRSDSLVLDIGAGTGLLGLLALRAGAGHVVSCEMNPSTARMAAVIARANGVADRLRIISKKSTDLILGSDLERPADVIVSEIVDNTLLAEETLLTHRDAVPRLLQPSGHVIPGDGAIMVALGHDPTLVHRRMGMHEGFDLSAFNILASASYKVPVGTPGLHLLTQPVPLFEFAFDKPGSWPGNLADVDVTVQAGGTANSIIQWIRLTLDRSGVEGSVYEAKPGPGRKSCWAAMSWPLNTPLALTAGENRRIAGRRTDSKVTIWLAD